MKCSVCPKTIPPERLELNPRIRTCSKPCSIEHTKRSRVEYGRMWRKAKKEEAQANGS